MIRFQNMQFNFSKPLPYNFYCLFLVMLVSNSINAQTFDTNYYNRIDFYSSFVEQPKTHNRSHYMDTKVDFNFYLSAIKNSGKLIIGGQQVDYLNSIIKNISTNQFDKTSCIVRSKEVGTFSTDSVIYITTGLIAQLENSHQLAFFLARELSSEKQSYFWEDRMKYGFIASSYDGKIKALTHRTNSEEIELDRKGYELIKSRNYYSDQVQQSLEVLKYAHLPFEVVDVPEDYLNSDEYYIPQFYYKFSESMKFGILDSDSSIYNRIKSLNFETKPSHSFKDTSLRFSTLSKSARFDYLDQSISNGEFELAIYTIYILEHQYNETDEYLRESKAIAWYGLALREVGVTPPKNSNYYKQFSNSGVNFLLTLRRLPTAAKVSIALRIVGDYREKVDSNTQLWKNLLYYINEYPFINLRDFSPVNYYETFRSKTEPVQSVENSKYDKIQSIEKQKRLEQDSSKFFLYGLADYVRDSSFWTQVNALKVHTINDQSTFIVAPSIAYMKKRKPDALKSTEALSKLMNELENYDSVKKVININDIDSWLQNRIKHNYSQQYSTSFYKDAVPSKIEFAQDEIFNEEADYIIFPFFQSTYRPRLKSAYFTGLFVVPIPFIVSDFLLKSFQSSYSILVVNTKTNEVIHTEYVAYNEPLTTVNMLERISNSINQITLIHE